jgi:hypothetical protein
VVVAPHAAPDWRVAQDYAWLETVPREAYAWEWLRRQPDYREAAMAALESSTSGAPAMHLALRWNLHAFEDPRLSAIEARPMWTRKAYPSVLCAFAKEAIAPDADTFTLAQFEEFATIIEHAAGQHLLLSDGRRSVRLDIRGARLGEAPVCLRYRLCGVRSLGAPIETLRRFKFFVEQHRFSARLHPPEPRARRMILVLRAFDALSAGATQRDLAAMLDEEVLRQPGWRSDFPSLRARAQRLAGTARAFAGGFWELLLA